MITYFPKLKKKILLLVVTICIMFLGVAAYRLTQENTLSIQELKNLGVIIFKQPRIFSIENMRDHRNFEFKKNNLLNKWSLIYLGYTNCPDVCPATLSQLNALDKELKKKLPNIAKHVQYIMISLDPRRDTVEKLSQYMPYFNSDFIGITGPLEETYKITQQLNIPFFLHKNTEDISYLIDHSSHLIIINPNGDYHGFIKPSFSEKKLINSIKTLVKTTQ